MTARTMHVEENMTTSDTLDETLAEPTTTSQTDSATGAAPTPEPSVADKARQIGFKGVDRGRELAAGGLDKLAQTMHNISGETEPGQPAASDIATSVATGSERAASYLRSTDARTMAGKVEQVARQVADPGDRWRGCARRPRVAHLPGRQALGAAPVPADSRPAGVSVSQLRYSRPATATANQDGPRLSVPCGRREIRNPVSDTPRQWESTGAG